MHRPVQISCDADYVCVFVCVSDLLFGVPGKHTGVTLYSRKRVVTYTITIALGNYDARFVNTSV